MILMDNPSWRILRDLPADKRMQTICWTIDNIWFLYSNTQIHIKIVWFFWQCGRISLFWFEITHIFRLGCDIRWGIDFYFAYDCHCRFGEEKVWTFDFLCPHFWIVWEYKRYLWLQRAPIINYAWYFSLIMKRIWCPLMQFQNTKVKCSKSIVSYNGYHLICNKY